MGGFVGRTYFVVVVDNGVAAYLQLGDADGGDMVSKACQNEDFLPPAPAAPEGTTSPIGVEFTTTSAGAVITGMTAGGSGEKSGLKTAMVVVKVNGIGIKGMSSDLLGQLLTGIDGTASLELASGEVIRVTKP